MKLADKLKELSIPIPESTAKFGNYLPFLQDGNKIYISGQLPIKDGTIISGKVDSEVTLEEANNAAKLCIINTLIILNSIDNDIDLKNLSCIQLSGFVNADNKFNNHPDVINGASDFMYEVLGDNGMHTRIAVGCSSLPKNACVEISSIFSLKG
tara:strand:+ start:1187 stop:1648 length:462 start_codon:yes stop_codon:yes gene_type:complete